MIASLIISQHWLPHGTTIKYGWGDKGGGEMSLQVAHPQTTRLCFAANDSVVCLTVTTCTAYQPTWTMKQLLTWVSIISQINYLIREQYQNIHGGV